jgi:aryl-alcohol dehydrogenase-like predicted oxidoreductase
MSVHRSVGRDAVTLGSPGRGKVEGNWAPQEDQAEGPRAEGIGFVPFSLVARIAATEGATPAQVALAWLLARKPWIVPIPGTTKLQRLRENVGGVDVALTPEDMAEIDEASSKLVVQGDRYDAASQAMIDR